MPSPAASTAAAKSVLRRFRRSRRASAAVEFALVAPVFFALLFAIIETGIMFFANQVLETMAQDAARQVLTGQAQTNPSIKTLQDFEAAICPPLPAPQPLLFTCANIFVNVQSYTQFSSVTINNMIDANGNFDPSTLGYNPGGPGSIVVVQLFYKWPLFVTGLGYNIANLSGNQRELMATAVFQNEPY
ncbi:MAG: TadE/TadG family type IV pilus assembly protein [Bradyrhizobium sp.]